MVARAGKRPEPRRSAWSEIKQNLDWGRRTLESRYKLSQRGAKRSQPPNGKGSAELEAVT
jgi:hypothetical protein